MGRPMPPGRPYSGMTLSSGSPALGELRDEPDSFPG